MHTLIKSIFILLLIPNIGICASQEGKATGQLPVKSSPVGKDKVTIGDSQNINPTNNLPRSRDVELEDFPVSIPTQAALDLKANNASTVMLWSEWPNGAPFTTSSSPVAYNGAIYKCIAPYTKNAGEYPNTQTDYFAELGGGTGDIEGIIAGTGLSGGGTTGTVTLSIDPAYVQRRVSSSCAAGASIRAIAADGTVTCEPDDSGGVSLSAANTWTAIQTFSNGISASSIGSTAADGAHYLDVVNSVAISATATLGRTAYFNGRMRLADGIDWDGYFLEDTDLGMSVGTFLATPSSANLRGAVTDESGTGALIFAGGDIAAATATTPSAGDDDTSVPTTAFVHDEVATTQTGTHSSPSTNTPLTPTWTGLMHVVWYGATGTINLPAAASYTGKGILIYNTGAFTITIDPNSSEVIVREDGTAQIGGVGMTLASGAGNKVALVSDGARWIVTGGRGTLAAGS